METQVASNRWANVGLWLQLFATRHCWRADSGPTLVQTLKFQQLKYCYWSNVGPSTTQRWIMSCGANDGPTHTRRLYRVIFLNLRFTLIMQNLHNLFLENCDFVLQ